MFKKIVLAYDHRVQSKYIDKIKEILSAENIECLEVKDDDAANDYPILTQKAIKLHSENRADGLILLCGSGIGMNISANKFDGIRSVLPSCEAEAFYARRHENANCLCFGVGLAYDDCSYEIKPLCRRKMARIIEVFLSTEFEAGRHNRRLDEIKDIEKNN